jgi:ATP adenylyltransferase
MMNKYPYNAGHLMVIPRRHIKDLSKLKALEHRVLGETLAVCIKVLKKVYRPQGFNVGMNLERVAGAGITDHLHYHIVPRWNGDTNFMPVFADTRVLVEALEETYNKLRKAFGQ